MSVNLSNFRGRIGLLPPNRVWRTYPGGRVLDQLEGKDAPGDTHFPEDWIGSTTRAINPGRDSIEEGVAQVQFGDTAVDLLEAIEADAVYFLGQAHLDTYGANPMVLVKFIDSADRLHLQCHPTAAFAQAFLDSPSGKTEAYYILSNRDEVADPYIYLGFQRPPSPGILKTWIEEQNIGALLTCFDRIPVQPGDTFIIPGGFPHALGEGLFLVEIQEPSDLVVRFEFERAGYVIPESARFMNRGLNFCLNVFDFQAMPVSEVQTQYRPEPVVLKTFDDGSMIESLIGSDQTDCFAVERLKVKEQVELGGGTFSVNIVIDGACTVSDPHGETRLRRYDRFLCPHGLESIQITTTGGAQILRCLPPKP
jgi:mannose-6-phosphate isomerase